MAELGKEAGKPREWGTRKKIKQMKDRAPIPPKENFNPRPQASAGEPTSPTSPVGPSPKMPRMESPADKALPLTEEEAVSLWAANFYSNYLDHPSVVLSPKSYPNIVSLAETASHQAKEVFKKRRGKNK